MTTDEIDFTIWLPSQDSAARWVWLCMESNLHRPLSKGGPSLSEMVWATGDIALALAKIPASTTSDVRARTGALLAPWPKGRYTLAFRRSGGILNLFSPLWDGEEDVWKRMVAMEKESMGGQGYEPSLRLQHAWNHTPLSRLGGLTPAQAMVGVGPQEADLTRDFLVLLEEECGERAFEYEEELLETAFEFLWDWRENLDAEGLPLFEVVVAERSALLARREELMATRRQG